MRASGMSGAGTTPEGGATDGLGSGSSGVGPAPGAAGVGDVVTVTPELLRGEYQTWVELRDDLQVAHEEFLRTKTTAESMGLVKDCHPPYDSLWQRIDAWFASGVVEFGEIGETMRQTAKDYYDTEIEAVALGQQITGELDR